MIRPGISGKPFNIYFSNDWVKKGEYILPSQWDLVKSHIERVLNFLGCYFDYQLKVLSDPIKIDAGGSDDDESCYTYQYEVRVTLRRLHIFGILVYTDKKLPKRLRKKN